MKKLQGVFIGFGKIAELGHWPGYQKSNEAEMIAVMDPSAERRAVAATLKPGLRTYPTVDELFQSEKFDFVDICTPPSAGYIIRVRKALSTSIPWTRPS